MEIKPDDSGKSYSGQIDELVVYLDKSLAPLEYPDGLRVQLSMATFSIALEHLWAISQLFKMNLYASAFALIRSLFEATIKGTWIHLCASDSSLEKYARGKELSSTKILLEELKSSKLPKDVFDNLNDIQGSYKIFSSFTHAGFYQVAKWVVEEDKRPSYTNEEVAEALNTTIVLGFITGLEFARMSGNQKVIAELTAHIPP